MKAMILCGGFGTRLGELTRDVPKPLLTIGECTLLEHTVAHLAAHRFDEIVINLHFLPERIPAVLGEGARYGARISYLHEPELTGTAGAVRAAREQLDGDEPFLVIYGDILTDLDFSAVVDRHRGTAAVATILIHERRGSNSVVVWDKIGRVTKFLERPSPEERSGIDSPWVFSGMMIGDNRFLNRIPDKVPCDLPKDVFAGLIVTGDLYAHAIAGYRCAIDSVDRLDEARRALAEGRVQLRMPG